MIFISNFLTKDFLNTFQLSLSRIKVIASYYIFILIILNCIAIIEAGILIDSTDSFIELIELELSFNKSISSELLSSKNNVKIEKNIENKK